MLRHPETPPGAPSPETNAAAGPPSPPVPRPPRWTVPDRLRTARGILLGLAISLALWALIAAALFRSGT